MNKILKMAKYSVFNRGYLRQIYATEKNLVLNHDELHELQWRKLREILIHAYSNCPYYRKLYRDHGVKIGEVRDFGDFRKIPMIAKTEIRNNLDTMISLNVDRNSLEEFHTSGTTGVPLKIFRDRQKKDLMNALYLRTIRFWGCDIGSKTSWMWGLPRELEHLNDYRYQSTAQRFISNQTWFNAYDITHSNMLQYWRFMNSYRPDLIISHVSVLCEYANFLRNNNLRIHAPKAIWITAEPSDFSQRQFIEKSFGARTFNQYGSSEILHIAAECSERAGLHIHADSRYVEIVDSNNRPVNVGELGNIVITDLENKVMPLIRYKTDDVGSLKNGNCRCGINLPIMGDVVGRVLDTIKLKNGKKIFGFIFAQILFEYIEQIKQFQVHQTSPDTIIVRIVPGRLENLDGLRSGILTNFKKYTEDLVDYSFEVVDHIEREKSGKLRYVKSDV